MKLTKETICEDTLYVIKEYYHLNLEPLFSLLADDCVWLGIGNLLVSGAETIKAQFKNGFIMPEFEVTFPNFRFIDTKCDEQLIVLGEYTLEACEKAEIICNVRQRLTFCYRLQENEYRLFHMHVSNEYNELVNHEVFPLEVTTRTYRYVQGLLAENRKNNIRRLQVKENGTLSFIHTDTIMYIQAAERESILHLYNETRRVQASVKEIMTQLPPHFYRVHRSYFINCDYVTKIARYQLTLVNDEVLPIPKMRYMQIKNDIAEIINKKRKQNKNGAESGNI